MPSSFDQTKQTMTDLFGGHEYSTHAYNAFATPRPKSFLERAFTDNLKMTAAVSSVVAYGILAARVNLP